ncbi:MAG TPA: exopolysaccharide Pel transporter PelG, partial [Oscillospiraceae bacterium]|nr:exopolysaccharide Pel transporter PelG [Oscillospiraceae bacterium]
MAGIGIQLNRIFNKHTVIASFYGIAFSIVHTIGPLLIVIGCILLMYKVLGFHSLDFIERELFSCSVIYIFIFSLLIT